MENQAKNKVKATKKTTVKAVKTEVKKETATVKKIATPKVAATPKVEAKPIVKEMPKVEAPKVKPEKSTMEKVIEAGKTTSKIVTKAGTKIIGSSIETTKTIAGIFDLGKELLSDTNKVVAKNRKNVRDTSVQAFKETVEAIKETNLIENPLKGMMKSKKK
jgi:hypothetical protein